MFSPEICSQNRRSRPPTLMGRVQSRQAGMTAVGLLLLAIFVGLFAFAAMRLTPVYLNYMKVAGVLDGVFKEFDSQAPSRASISKSIRRRFDVESVSVITARDIRIINEGNHEVGSRIRTLRRKRADNQHHKQIDADADENNALITQVDSPARLNLRGQCTCISDTCRGKPQFMKAYWHKSENGR